MQLAKPFFSWGFTICIHILTHQMRPLKVWGVCHGSFLLKLLYCIPSAHDSTEIAGAQKRFLNWMLEENTDRSKRINVGLHVLAQRGKCYWFQVKLRSGSLIQIIQPVLPWMGCMGLWCGNSEGDCHRFQPRGQWDVTFVGQGISVWPASDSVRPGTIVCVCVFWPAFQKSRSHLF